MEQRATSSWRRRLAWGLAVLAVLVAAAWLLLPRVLGFFVVRALADGARKQCGLRLEAGRAELNPFTARFSIRDLKLFNPPGFGRELLLSVPEFTVDFNLTAAILHRARHFEAITLNVQEFDYERRADGVSNLDSMLKLGRNAGFSRPPVPAPAPPPPTAPEPAEPPPAPGAPSSTPSSRPADAPAAENPAPAENPAGGGVSDGSTPPPKVQPASRPPRPAPAPRRRPAPPSFRIDHLRLTLRELHMKDPNNPFFPEMNLDLHLVDREYRAVASPEELSRQVLQDVLGALLREQLGAFGQSGGAP